MAASIVNRVSQTHKTAGIKVSIFVSILLIACASQNIIPVHIAFIPILIPPLLGVFNFLQIDRRAVASTIAFGIIATYMFIPVGFGNIYLNQILAGSLNSNGLAISPDLIPIAMAFPVLGMLLGLLIAVFWTYRKPRHYKQSEEISSPEDIKASHHPMELKALLSVLFSIIAALGVQLFTGSMMMGGAVGFMVLVLCGVVRWQEADDVFSRGLKIMSICAFIMISASGFSEVLRQTGDIQNLVEIVQKLVYGHKALAAFLMLSVGLLISMGVGSSFSTVPIISTFYVPLSLALGFSPLATAIIIGTSGALGDAASPASDSTIGPTIGLNSDDQHDHIRDSVIPSFIHFNIPMMLFAWIAAIIF